MTLTGIMRGSLQAADGEAEIPRLPDRFKAAELLAKHFGLLQTGEKQAAETEARRRAADAIEAAMAALTGEEAG